MLRWVLVALVLLVPVASAEETLDSLEEPHGGMDKVWEVTVTEEEAGDARALIFRNPPGRGFALIIYDADGTEIFIRNGTRGVQTLPALDPGPHRFFVRGQGEFQVTAKAFERIIKENNVSATLNGTDAYVLASARPYEINITGAVSVEWWPLTGASEQLDAPVSRAAPPGDAYVMTLRGEQGAPYTISLAPGVEPPTAETPAPGLLALLGLALVVALMRKR